MKGALETSRVTHCGEHGIGGRRLRQHGKNSKNLMLRRLVVAMDIPMNLAGVGDGRKDAARQQIALDLGKPQSTWLNEANRWGVKCSRACGARARRCARLGVFVSREMVRDDVHQMSVEFG